ncbi:hypothetical protein [Hungatella hathewayi]
MKIEKCEKEKKVICLLDMLCHLASIEGYTITQITLKDKKTGDRIK